MNRNDRGARTQVGVADESVELPPGLHHPRSDLVEALALVGAVPSGRQGVLLYRWVRVGASAEVPGYIVSGRTHKGTNA